MKLNRRGILLLFLLPAIGVITFFGIRSFIFSEINSKIDENLHALESSGFNVHYESLSVDWKTNVIAINQLLLEKKSNDSSCVNPEFISVGRIRAEGFSLLPIIFRGILSFDDLYIEDLKAVMHKNSQLKPENSSQRARDFTVNIDRSFIKSADFTFTDSLCQKITGIKSNLTMVGLELELKSDNPLWYQIATMSFDNTELDFPEAMYKFAIKEAKMDFFRKTIRLDSVKIVPGAGKIEFGKKKGFEIDRYDALIPFFEANNLAFSLEDETVTAGMAEIQFYLKVFRDKRQPFIKKTKLLPIEQLRELPFKLIIDSLKIRKSYASYEEFAEGSDEAGTVFFDNLFASLYNIDNSSKTGSTKLQAKATLLGKGDIDLFVNFPHEKNRRATISGSVTNFSLPEINSMLIPSTNIKIESGQMEKLLFNFSFNEISSHGEVELNYHDLKLVIFKDVGDKKDEPAKDNLKTFIMNTFVFRTNMDEDVPEEKRTGTIEYVRDSNRSIFNFWIKSVVSGIKSAYDLGKAEAKQIEKRDKKQERLSKREARKQRRAEKNRERG